MQLTSLSLALSRIMGGGAWSPLSLFAAGEQGAWYQPSDLTTLYQDAAGTTPVTAVEQRVGLMLDKSKGLALGSELVTNGDFSNGTTGWTGSTSSLSVVGGQLVATSITTYGIFYPSSAITTVPNTWYKVSFDVLGSTFHGMRVGTYNSGSDLGGINGVGPKTYNVFFKATTTTSYLWFQLDGTSGGSCTFDNISVKQIAGNHAFQATTTPNDKRPILSARVNLLTKTEQFDDTSVWTRTNVSLTANAAVAPDGTNTADLLYPTTSGTARNVNRSITGQTTGATFTTLIRLKSAGINIAYIYNVQGNQLLYVNLTNGTTSNVGTNISNLTSNIDSNGWVTVSFTSTLTIGGTCSWYTGPCDAPGSTQVTANGTSGIYIWGADLRPANIGNNIPAYQRVNTATDYDTTGFPYYLKADGTYTSMSTNSINFSATDKMTVVSGVRKLSDATASLFFETSTAFSSNNGAFAAFLPANPLSPDEYFGSRGTVTNSASTLGYSAPISTVLTGQSSISTPLVNLRVNGTQAATSSASQGTGNYGNYPLYLFARNNASLFFNGYFYGAIIRGATTSGTDLTNAESYMNTQSGGLY